jgi:F-type H+-transporting ATPase subunit gamma
MRQLNELSGERDAMGTIMMLTSAFEGVASMHISNIREQVLSSTQFFNELWRIYSQIRVDELFHFGRSQGVEKPIEKELLILITSEGSFSGDIDHKLLTEALKNYQSEKNDIVIIGSHGAAQLSSMGVNFVKSFKLPAKDRNINVMPIIKIIQKYDSTNVFYQRYISLTNQQINSIKLSKAVAERGEKVKPGEEVISESNYIFEPSTYDVVDHLENSMMQITLSEVILESKLAQYASRFRAMTVAHDKASDSFAELNTLYTRAKRYIKDERLKEVVNGIKAGGAL